MNKGNLLIIIWIAFLIICVILFALYQTNKDMCIADKARDYCAANNMNLGNVFNRYSFVCIDIAERLDHQKGEHKFYFTDKEKEFCNV